VDPRAVRATYLVSSVSCDLPTEQVTAGNALNKYVPVRVGGAVLIDIERLAVIANGASDENLPPAA
jgi:hypothetical protein